jgi:uncharacterized protein YgbK (DUF1537 family)
MPLTIVADDLTGACDTGALFAGGGRVGVFVEPAVPDSEWAVAVADTETRSLDPGRAGERVRRTAERLAPRLRDGRLFKKIDSTMRGAVGAEIESLLSAPARSALVCPAFPSEGRTVVNGLLRVHGAPAHESPVGRDPDYPGDTSDLRVILGRQVRCSVTHLPLGDVRAGKAGGRMARAACRPGIVVADAETDADLDLLAAAGAADPSMLLAGSAGLARRLALVLALAADPVPLPSGRRWLIVCGSLHPASRGQLDALAATGAIGTWLEADGGPLDHGPLVAALAAGRPAVITSPRLSAPPSPPARVAMAGRLASLAATVLAAITPDLVYAVGGETALALIQGLGAQRLDLLGPVASGLALSEIIPPEPAGARQRRLRLLTKAGGFGAADLLVSLIGGAEG